MLKGKILYTNRELSSYVRLPEKPSTLDLHWFFGACVKMRWNFIDCNMENDDVQPTLVWPFGGTLRGNGWDSPVGLGCFPLNYKPDWLFQTVFFGPPCLEWLSQIHYIRFWGWVKPTRNYSQSISSSPVFLAGSVTLLQKVSPWEWLSAGADGHRAGI